MTKATQIRQYNKLSWENLSGILNYHDNSNEALDVGKKQIQKKDLDASSINTFELRCYFLLWIEPILGIEKNKSHFNCCT